MAKVKLIETSEKFVVVLERSQLFAPNQLDAIKKLAETAEDPVQIARALLKNGWVTKWQASQMLSGFYHLTIGKYRLSEQLGKGELGNVYLAENPKLGRKVALKTLSKQFTGDPKLVARFLNEAKAAAALDHRNIVHIHDVTSEGQRHYVVMEYVSGRDLQSRIEADGKLPISEAVSIIQQAAEGLQHAHEQSVVHRDLKPANIIVDDQGVAKILDMGVGHLRKPKNAENENTGELMMSAIAYMAPEHARGKDVDARCDIYSLGGVLYYLLTARAPFSIETDAERAKIKETRRPIPLSEMRPDTPAFLADLCDRMLATQPDDRPPSMADVITALAGGDAPAADAAVVADDDTAEAELVEVESETPEPSAEKVVIAVKSKEPDSKSDSEAAAPAISIDVGNAKPAAPVAATGFSINTKRRKKNPASVPKAAEQSAIEEPATEETPQPTPKKEKPASTTSEPSATDNKPAPASPSEPKKGLPKAVLIGGAIAAALLLMVGSGVGALMLFGGGAKEVAQAPPASTANEASTDVTEDEAAGTTPSPDSLDADDSTAPLDAATDAAVGSEPASDVAAVEPGVASAVADGVEPEPVAAATTEPAPAADASAEMASEPKEPPADAMPEASAPEKPAEEPAPEKKPEPKKPPEKKAPPKPKTFVFQPAIDLPVPAGDAPVLTLGQINIRPEDAVFISMDGGDIAAGGRFEFSLQNAQDGVAPRDWEFYLSDGSTDPVVIATMSMPEKDLMFKWTQAGVDNSTATNLRNCSLTITAGQDQPQELALRTPQKIAPITIDLERSATAKLPLEGAPDRSSLKLEITVKGHKSMVEPSQIELGKGGEAIIYFGENQEQSALCLRIDASVNARGVQVKTDPYFIVPSEKSPVRLNKASIKKFESVQTQQAGLQSQIFEGQKAANDNKLPAQQKARIQGVLAEMKAQLELIDKTVQKMAQLNTDMAAVSSGASLQFRVFSDTFEKQIDLVVTDPNAAPVAP